MPPGARRDQILDAAVDLAVARDHAGFSLEQVADAAGVSTPLVYKYFPRREDLVQALLEREFEYLGRQGLGSIPHDSPLEDIVRRTVANALTYYFERGPIVRLLAADPAVAVLARERNAASRTSTSRYFVRRFVEAFGVPEDVAIIAVTMVVNAPILSVSRLRKRGIDAQRTIEVWSTFILGGWRALSAQYGASGSGPKRRP